MVNNEKNILKKIKKNGLELEFVVDEFKNNKIIVLAAVKQNGLALEFASDNLKNNKKIIITAINQNIHVLDFLHIWIKDYKSILNSFNYIDDKKIIFKIIKYKENFYKYLNNNIKEDINITKKLLKVNNNIFYFLLPIMFENIDILLLGLNSNNTIEIYQTKEDILKIIINAINRNIKILDFFHIWIKNYKNILEDLDYINDKKIIFKIIEYNPSLYIYLNNDIKNDVNITKELIKVNSNIYFYLLHIISINIDIVLLSLNNNIDIIDGLPLEMHQTKEVILKIIELYNLKNQYKKSKLQILHIGFIKLDNKYTEDYIRYRFIDFKLYNIDEIIKIFKYYLNIKNKDIVIFIELDLNCYSRYIKIELVKKHDTDEKICNLYKVLNEVIYNSAESHKNIKIINIMANNNSLNISYNFCKIVNITINDSSIITEKIYYNTNYEINNCIYKKIELWNNNFIINDMLATHWLNTLINTPNFLKGRQLQLSGTCWINAIFNSVYLVKSIRKDIFLKYEEYKKTKLTNFPIEYKNLRDPNYVHNIKDILYSLIGNLKNNIYHNINEDYIIVLAAFIKATRIYFHDIEIINKFKHYKTIDEPFHILCKASNSNKLRTILCSDKIKNKKDLDDLNNICEYKHPKSICDTFPENSDEAYGYIYGNGSTHLCIYEIIKVIFNIILLPNIPKTLVNTSILLIDRLIYPDFIISDKNINKYGNIYKLKSIYLSNPTHAICGIKNNNKYYIYDSAANIWIKEDLSKLLNNDKNNEIELVEYKKKYLTLYNTEKDSSWFKFYIAYLIYVC